MNKINFTLAFDEDERKELLDLLKDSPKWAKKINETKGDFGLVFDLKPYVGFISTGVPPWAPPLPQILNIGKRARVVSGSWKGWKGNIKSHYINSDDCSGWYGMEMYEIKKDHGESFSIPVQECEIIEFTSLGCIDDRYCPSCEVLYNSICLCKEFACEQCSGKTIPGIPKDLNGVYTRIILDQFNPAHRRLRSRFKDGKWVENTSI